MDFSPNGSGSSKSVVGIGTVIFIHFFLIYALVTGLARKVVDIVQKPVETMIVNETQPPPPPPSKLEVQPAKVVATPPPFVPPPEVKVQAAPVENAITAVTNVNNEPPPVAQSVAVEPPHAPEVPKAITHTTAKVAGNCERPEYPALSLKNEEEGVVIVKMIIGVDGTVVDSVVEKSSGFSRLDQATLKAWSLCRFTPAMADGQAVKSEKRMQYVWKLSAGLAR